MTYTIAVRDCTLLSSSSKYRISGESGEWRYSYQEFCGKHTYYTFWRFDVRDLNRRITRTLSGQKVYEKVSEISAEPLYKPIDLSKFESFRGE
jgi:hypothetical protein